MGLHAFNKKTPTAQDFMDHSYHSFASASIIGLGWRVLQIQTDGFQQNGTSTDEIFIAILLCGIILIGVGFIEIFSYFKKTSISFKPPTKVRGQQSTLYFNRLHFRLEIPGISKGHLQGCLIYKIYQLIGHRFMFKEVYSLSS
jgi:hypothetical protein